MGPPKERMENLERVEAWGHQIGWDPENKTIAADDKSWEDKIKAIPGARKFRYAGISPDLEDKLNRMFGKVVAAGEGSWAPSMGNVPVEEENIRVQDDMDTQTPGRDAVGGNMSTTIGHASTSALGKRKKMANNKGVSASYISELRETTMSMKPPSVVSIKEAVELISSISVIYDDDPILLCSELHQRQEQRRSFHESTT